MFTFSDRFVDRDMAMRYILGLGVGHTYAHSTSTNLQDSDSNIPERVPRPDEGGEEGEGIVHERDSEGKLEVDDGDDNDDEDHEDEWREEEEDGEEEDFDTGSDYTDDETVYSETGSHNSGEY